MTRLVAGLPIDGIEGTQVTVSVHRTPSLKRRDGPAMAWCDWDRLRATVRRAVRGHR